MSTYTAATYAFDMSIAANYQTLMGDIDSHIQSLGGGTYVPQTGDANPASTVPGSAGTYPAFRVYSTTSGATTWYMRVDYGHTAAGPSLKVQLGTSVNGSGVLGGQVCTQITITANSTSTGRSLHVGAATGRLMICFALSNASTATAGFSIHGAVDGSGNMNGNMEIYGVQSSSATTAQAVPNSGTVPPQQTTWPCNSSNQSSNTFAGVIPLFIPQLWDSGGQYNATLACFVYGSADLTVNTTTTVSLYGSMRTYIVTGNNGVNQSGSSMSALRFD